MSAFTSEQPNRARLFDERRNDGVSVTARNAAASGAQSVTTRARLFDERRNDGVSVSARNAAASDTQSVTTRA